MMSELKGKIDFTLFVSVDNANPYGDPLNGNRPRISMDGYGEISDDQLNKSINKIRARAGIANLTNALAKRIQEGVPANATKTVNQVMLDEIRRERALELYMEGFRCDDLKRWGIAEKNLNESRCGAVVGNASYPTAFVDEIGNATSAFNSAIFTKGTEEVETGKGKLPCVVLLK